MVAQYVLGFKTLADRLGEAVVGGAVTDQVDIPAPDGKEMALQVTEKGLMVYGTGGQPMFLAGITTIPLV